MNNIQDNLLFRMENNLKNHYISKNLNEYEIFFINNLIIKHPEIIYNIQNKIEIIIDEVILNFHNVPDIIIILFENYKEYIIEYKIKNINIKNIIIFTLDSLFDKNLIKFNMYELSILNKLINSSMNLLLIDSKIVIKDNEDKIPSQNYCFTLFPFLS